MKAITLTQPWAQLVAIGAKKVETRSWSTSYRGPLAIHAAKGLGPVGGRTGLHALCGSRPFCDVLLPAGYSALRVPAWGMPLGKIVAVCELVDCVETWPIWATVEPWFQGRRDAEEWDVPPAKETNEYAFGDYAPGRFAWLLADIRALPEPIEARGALSLWEWDAPAGI